MKRRLRAWCFPILLGVFVFVAGFFPETRWAVVVACVFGYVLGYADPWNSKGEPR